MTGKCPICGETDPLPGSYCLPKMTGSAVAGQPCNWSVEGAARTKADMLTQYELYEAERVARLQKAQNAARSPTHGGRDG